MNKEKTINEINKLIDEIVGMLEDEEYLIEFKKTIEQVYVTLKVSKEITERLKNNIIDNLKGEENESN